MIGQKFGKWTVVGETDELLTRRNLKAWLCKCDCGKLKHRKAVSEQSLKSGKSKSCGRCVPWREWKGPKDTKHE